jgi:parallel beta-helix repeat protein
MDMRRLLVAIILLFSSACAQAIQPPVTSPPVDAVVLTQIGGVSTGETVLDGAYLLVTDLLIPQGSRLVIKPGTTILVRRAELTKIDPEFLSSMTEILIRGTVLIEGSADAPVVIAAEKATSAADPAWAGVLLDGVESSSIHNARISGAETGLLMIDAEVELSYSRLEKNRYGVVIQSGRPLLKNNLISKGEAGLFIWNGAAPTLIENVIRQNAEEGIYIERLSRPILNGNRSVQNAIGLVSATLPDAKELQMSSNGEAWRELPARQAVQR